MPAPYIALAQRRRLFLILLLAGSRLAGQPVIIRHLTMRGGMDELAGQREGGSLSADISAVAFVRRTPPTPTPVFETYWRFASERQSVYLQRVRKAPPPWTADKILQLFKFTNPYRAADRVSQYLIRHVIYDGQAALSWRDVVLRTLLFKIFNKIETWQLLESSFGTINEETFSAPAFGEVLGRARAAGASIYSAAYIMPSGPADIRAAAKHEMHLALLTRLLKDGLAEQLQLARTMEGAYKLLLAIPSFGPFLAYQFITDLNYSKELGYSEMEFVVPGPGARDGIRKCFSDLGDYTEAEVIRWVAERQQDEFCRLGLTFSGLWGRPLQLIDCQNLFCEVDKYARVAHPEARGRSGRERIKQKYGGSSQELPQPWFPPSWGINEEIARELKSAQ